MIVENHQPHWGWLILLGLTIMAALTFEHSLLDVYISELFYTNGHWLLEKGGQPYAFIFYDFPKALLILMVTVLLITLISRYFRHRPCNIVLAKPLFIPKFTMLPNREIGYLIITLIAVPTIIAALKAVTHVSCPNQLSLFNGDLPYLNLWQHMSVMTPT